MVISCSISCSIYDDGAKLHFEIALPITVGDNVWIGANVSVLPGVLSEHHKARFCNTDCTKAHQQAEAMFSRLVKQLSEKEGVTEALKEENQMLWVQRINNIRSAAMEIVSSELIYC